MTSDTPEGMEPTNVPQTWPASPDEVATGAEAAQAPEAGAYTPAAPVPYVAAPPTSNNAIIAFVLSIVAWAVCPIIPAIVALVLAASAQKEIAAGQGRVQGQGLVTAAKIISWINIGLWAAIFVIGAFFLILALVAGA
ncbi:MAG: DUF4190 domain-containing protein [Actinomycetota bacterium]|nr:DUF4190 domain-containing protein [Actinomycetota bacterium]